ARDVLHALRRFLHQRLRAFRAYVAASDRVVPRFLDRLLEGHQDADPGPYPFTERRRSILAHLSSRLGGRRDREPSIAAHGRAPVFALHRTPRLRATDAPASIFNPRSNLRTFCDPAAIRQRA